MSLVRTHVQDGTFGLTSSNPQSYRNSMGDSHFHFVPSGTIARLLDHLLRPSYCAQFRHPKRVMVINERSLVSRYNGQHPRSSSGEAVGLWRTLSNQSARVAFIGSNRSLLHFWSVTCYVRSGAKSFENPWLYKNTCIRTHDQRLRPNVSP